MNGARPLTERRTIMDTTLALIIFCELLLTLAIVYGIMHEQALIRFERKAAAKLRTAVKRAKAKKARKNREKFNARVTYTPVKPAARPTRTTKEAA